MIFFLLKLFKILLILDKKRKNILNFQKQHFNIIEQIYYPTFYMTYIILSFLKDNKE